MNEDNTNNNNDPEFDYYPDYGTTCIFFKNPITLENNMLRWRQHPHRHRPPSFPRSTCTILSSSLGLLLCHMHSPSTSISTYYVGNPFCENLYDPFFDHHPHFSDTHAVLAAFPSCKFHIICLLPNATQQGNLYAIKTFTSSLRTWFYPSIGTHLHDEMDRVVIPNSGISCGRFAYWLTWLASSRSKMSVVRVDVKHSVDPVKYPLLTFLEMSECLPEWDDGVVRMKLGRVRNRVGLVVVNERETRVELYMMKEMGSVKGNEEDDDAVMVEWEPCSVSLEVDVDQRMEEGAVELVEPNRIRCKEMPEAMRFEGYKMEVVLALGGPGKRRMVMWESKTWDRWRTRVVVIGVAASDGAAAYPVDSGIPHISNSTLPNIAAREEYVTSRCMRTIASILALLFS